MAVGSSDWLGQRRRGRKWFELKCMTDFGMTRRSSLRWGCRVNLPLRFETESFGRPRSRARQLFCSPQTFAGVSPKLLGNSSWETLASPNVKDEPRPWPARLLRHSEADSDLDLRS